MIRHLAAALACTSACTVPAAAQLRVVTYNTLDAPISATQEAQAATIFGAIAAESVNGLAVRPALILLQEQETRADGDTPDRLAAAVNRAFGGRDYRASLLSFGTDRVAAVYDATRLSLETSQTRQVPIGIRPGWRGVFDVVGYDGLQLGAVSTHFKAGSEPSDVTRRLGEATLLRRAGDGLAADGVPDFIYGGDFNIKSGEAAYDRLTGLDGTAGAGRGNDPLRNSRWGGAFESEIYTQSTRVNGATFGGAGGGIDDRFDLQLVSDSLMDGEGLSYIGPTAGVTGSVQSYRAFGNDGTSFNQAINANRVGRSQPQDVLDALWAFSDHLPVVADYQLPASLAFSTNADDAPLRAIVGGGLTLDITTRNDAPVAGPLGADELDYVGLISGDASAFIGGEVLATTGGRTDTVTIDTATACTRTFSIAMQNLSPQGRNASETRTVTATVLNPGNASFSGDADVDAATLELGTTMVGVATPASVEIFNRAAGGQPTASLLVSAPEGATRAVAAGASADIALRPVFTAAGPLSQTLQLGVADEAVPGARVRDPLALTLTGRVLALGDYDGDAALTAADIDVFNTELRADMPVFYADLSRDGVFGAADRDVLVREVFGTVYGDADLSGGVNLGDFAALGRAFGQSGTGWASGDFTGDALTNLADFARLGANFGRAAGDAAPRGAALVAESADDAGGAFGIRRLVVDVVSGVVTLVAADASLTGFELESPAGGLDPNGLALTDALADTTAIASPTVRNINGAVFPLGSSVLLDGRLSLGAIYDTALDTRDLIFRATSETFVLGSGFRIDYIPEPAGLLVLSLGGVGLVRRRG